MPIWSAHIHGLIPHDQVNHISERQADWSAKVTSTEAMLATSYLNVFVSTEAIINRIIRFSVNAGACINHAGAKIDLRHVFDIGVLNV